MDAVDGVHRCAEAVGVGLHVCDGGHAHDDREGEPSYVAGCEQLVFGGFHDALPRVLEQDQGQRRDPVKRSRAGSSAVV